MTNEVNQDRTQHGNSRAGGVILFVCRARKHVCNGAPQDRSDDAEHDRPEDRYVHSHHRFRDDPRDGPIRKIPNQVKQAFPRCFMFKTSSDFKPGSGNEPHFPMGLIFLLYRRDSS
jgi:hypothetical protein